MRAVIASDKDEDYPTHIAIISFRPEDEEEIRFIITGRRMVHMKTIVEED